MPRVLHILTTDADEQGRRCAQMLTGPSVTFGPGGDFRNTADALLRLRTVSAGADIIHAHGTRAALAAALASKHPVVATIEAQPPQNALRWLRAAATCRPVQFVFASETQRRSFVERGLPMDVCHLIRPAVDFSRLRRCDPGLRAALGFKDGDHVFLAAGESTRAANHQLAVWTCGILHELDERRRLLVWGRGEESERLLRFAPAVAREGMMISAPKTMEWEALLCVADTLLVTATRPVALWPICAAMAAGVPIVGVVSSTASEILEDRHNALLTGEPAARPFAQRILDLLSDPRRAWLIRDQARADAYEYFSISRFRAEYEAVYGIF